MSQFPISYIEPVYRPPSEAKSLILPVTNGCSWNKCTFCEMYTQPQKKFRARKDEDIQQDIDRAAQAFGSVRRVFLADGDAMVLPTRRLLGILASLRDPFTALPVQVFTWAKRPQLAFKEEVAPAAILVLLGFT
ncbi:MAG: hypothetical protein R3276_00395, partial [Marinobacter sp.]|nr:hypothetical protein [Marinobacter sp.]